jgi:hypothetical protein
MHLSFSRQLPHTWGQLLAWQLLLCLQQSQVQEGLVLLTLLLVQPHQQVVQQLHMSWQQATHPQCLVRPWAVDLLLRHRSLP